MTMIFLSHFERVKSITLLRKEKFKEKSFIPSFIL